LASDAAAGRPGDQVTLEVRDDVAVLRVDNPPVNLLHPDVARQIGELADGLADRDDVRCVVLTGTGRHFVGGGDLRYVRTLDPEAAEAYVRGVQDRQLGLLRLPQPVIAAVNGSALGGGCELAMACDIRVSAASAIWGQPEVGLGIIPGAGGTQNLPRLVGTGRAKWLVFTGRRITAAEAYDIGLVDLVVPDDAASNDAVSNDEVSNNAVLDAALEVARAIAANAPLAVRAAKRAINEGIELGLEEAYRLEARLFAPLVATADFGEGAQAFFDKRPPQFNGK